METRSKATRDLALSDDVNPSAEFPARTGESTPASEDLGYIGAAGIVGDSRPSSTRPPTEVMSPHMSIHEADIDGPPLLQRADLAPITSSSINPCPPTTVRSLACKLIPFATLKRHGLKELADVNFATLLNDGVISYI